jgi:hypothetical protein
MLLVTLAIAIVGIVIAFSVSPPSAIGVMILSMLVYPEYLRIPIGLANMSVPRIIAIALIIRFLARGGLQGFRWRLVDGLVCFEWVWSVAAVSLAGAGASRTNEVIGRVFDTAFMYFAARFCLKRAEDYKKLVWPLVLCAIVAGFLGVVEAVTYRSPYQWMMSYSAITTWDFEMTQEVRYGFLRAQGATGMPIYFGVAMALVLGMLYSVRGFAPVKPIFYLGCAGALFGSLSSMSSGPQTALIAFAVAASFWFYPRLIKPALIALVGLCIAMELGSHRHFWHLIEYINPIGGDAWYRARLIDVALMQWRDFCLIGVGSKTPNHWGMLIDGRLFVDLVNDYVVVAVTGGVLMLACHIAIQIIAIREAVWTYRNGNSPTRKLAFGQIAALTALMTASMSVGLFGPPLLLSYLLMGMMVRRPLTVGSIAVTTKRKVQQIASRREQRAPAATAQ